MTESAAICEYLAQAGTAAGLRVERDESDYPAYLNWLHRSDTTLTFPLTLVLRYSKLEPPERQMPQVVEDYSRWFLKRAECVEEAVRDADYLCANRFTAADIAVVYAIYLANKLGLGSNLGPATRNYLERACARPGFKRASALQADMEPVL